MAKQFTLGKKERLKSRKSIEQLFTAGKKIMASPYKVLYNLEKESKEPGLLFAVGVSSKNFKKAVDRNRIKRLTREVYRLQKKDLQERILSDHCQLSVFFIYTSKEMPAYEELSGTMHVVLNKLEKLIGK